MEDYDGFEPPRFDDACDCGRGKAVYILALNGGEEKDEFLGHSHLCRECVLEIEDGTIPFPFKSGLRTGN